MKHKREAENPDAANEKDNSVTRRRGNSSTSLTGNTGPHLRRSVYCGIVSQLQTVVNDMEQKTGVSSDPQPDSFFTWDSGGSSGDYSFVHTAVELPKYPDGAITEEERQMLLLYMQTGHPELLLNASNGSVDGPHSLLGPPPTADSVMCDQATVRGFLETIVEENSDDLRSPSDCDEASVGWGSWDESDDDRVTVVEMDTSDQNQVPSDFKQEFEDLASVTNINVTKSEKTIPTSGYTFPDNIEIQNAILTAKNQLGDGKLPNQQLVALSCATSVNNCAFDNRDGVCTNVTVDNSGDLSNVSGSIVLSQTNAIQMDTNSKVSLSYNEISDFENLWISASKLENASTETVDPWSNTECHSLPVYSDIGKVNIDFNNYGETSNENSLLMLGSDNLCLVPSGVSESDARNVEQKLMFSDDFKDYFLPTDNCVPTFNSNNEDDKLKDVFVTENVSANTKMRCFRIGFETESLETVSNVNDSDSVDGKMSPANSENENSGNDMLQETLFSPRDGDVVYGSTWLDDPAMKKPEKSLSPAEARFSTMHSESPPMDNIRKSHHLFDQSASDDEVQQVPNSLSRWQHHTDLQHVQEVTSPITRWQHQTNLQLNIDDDKFCKMNNSDEETDDGLPPQLKQIYSSFKMKDKKMARIRIKDDKNTNFKKLSLWDNETKVTLPPFITTDTHNNISHTVNNKEPVKESDLDDLELDMFSINESNETNKMDISSNADLEIDDALKSFNHLDDYSSNSEENSESENSYTVNTVTNIDYDNEDLSNPPTPDPAPFKTNQCISSVDEHLKSENENVCSDNSDNCPLCTDPSFKNSKINDIFAIPEKESYLDNDVQSLLLNTFPKIPGLAETSKSNEGVDSASPLTSSDSDEGIRIAKDIKKRVKRRLKDNSSVELKHDDSGYVEDDEDDDDDSIEEKQIKDPMQMLSNGTSNNESSKKNRKSLSTAFYESKSVAGSAAAHNESIPKSFEEFSNQLEKSALAEDVKGSFIDKEPWNIPKNLSQFSAWLLDNELKKISCRDEMEKLIVNDIMCLREQTIAQFLKHSSVEVKGKHLLPSVSEIDASTNSKLGSCSKENLNIQMLKSIENNVCKKEFQIENLLTEKIIKESENEENSDTDKTNSDENLDDKMLHSSEELDSEYYSYNVNSNVSKILTCDSYSNRNKKDITKDSRKVTLERNNDHSNSNKEEEIINEIIGSTENKLSFPEAEEGTKDTVLNTHTEYEAKFDCYNNNAISSDELKIQTGTNTKTASNKKEDGATERHRDADDIDLEKRAKVICTTTSVTSNEEPTTNDLEVNESALIDPSKIGETDVCEVTPSVGNVLNYEGKDEILGLDEMISKNIVSVNDNSDAIRSETNMLLRKINSKFNYNTECLSSCDNLQTQQSEDTLQSSESAIENLNKVTDIKELNDELLKKYDVYNSLESDSDIIPAPVDFGLFSGEVAPSSVDILSYKVETSGNEVDLMVSDANETKGAYEGFVNDIILLEAKAVSKEVDANQHVTDVDYHSHDELAGVTLPVVNDNDSCTLPTQSVNSGLSENCLENFTEKPESEEVKNRDVISPDDSEYITSSNCDTVSDELSTNFGNNASKEGISSDIQTELKVSEYNSEYKVHDKENLESFVTKDISHLNNLYKSKSVTVLQTEDFFEEDENEYDIFEKNDELNFSDSLTDKNLNSEIETVSFSECTENFNALSTDENCDKILSARIKSSDDLSIICNTGKVVDIREKYKRSRSVGRENQTEKETFESWDGQSKSTPDLSRCHDQQPLSALLSKSVSQRIQDYLGKSTRGSVLNRSLPPNERSRHYRRICVSTETVVEKAARFEARSRSSGRESTVEPINSRSGSCPPLNMRTSDVMKSIRNYSKPTAAVRPTVDIYRSSRENDSKMVNGAKKTEEDLFELITGYTKATKVTHKPPPVPLATSQFQQSVKSYRLKGKIASARKEFFERLSSQDLRPKTEPKQSPDVDIEDDTCGLRRFNEFRKSAREERARLAQSHPDLGALEAAVRSSRRRIDQLKKRRQKGPSLDAGPRPSSDASMPVTTTTRTKDGTLVLPYRRCTGEIAWASCAKRLQEAKARSESKSQEPLEIVDERRFKRPAERASLRAHDYENAADDPGPAISGSDFSRARSMDFLLDNREGAEPPENRLAQRVKSEHELRIERSLQNLTLPDWYTQSKKPKEGFILRRGSEGKA